MGRVGDGRLFPRPRPSTQPRPRPRYGDGFSPASAPAGDPFSVEAPLNLLQKFVTSTIPLQNS